MSNLPDCLRRTCSRGLFLVPSGLLQTGEKACTAINIVGRPWHVPLIMWCNSAQGECSRHDRHQKENKLYGTVAMTPLPNRAPQRPHRAPPGGGGRGGGANGRAGKGGGGLQSVCSLYRAVKHLGLIVGGRGF